MSPPSLLAALHQPAIVSRAPPSPGAADASLHAPPAHGRRPLPPNVELRACTAADLPHLKRLTSLLLPIPYPDKFYKDIVSDPVTNSITLLAVWHDDTPADAPGKGRLIGAIRCRLLEPSTAPVLYLSTLVLLSPYRKHGIATHLLRTVVQKAAEDYGVTRVAAHVWEANVDGLAWYRQRGFRETGRESEYYRRLEPSGAVLVERAVGVADLLRP
ncbi:hypothetical protein CERZMDRAFT_47546 [Cercospora zeae-maydis SCOH1-5]|uniref:N-acetyltransferase domain-containing protein n=1 Tax=Cercospora zeae-maydis SCOH1-5 TaxID=717836 RepID=A0A6A6F8F0_9PEZI|nr:hypothetical protein CERZMDRAFT_47546 [Cercospora zeae-maydis SCOH1-5]